LHDYRNEYKSILTYTTDTDIESRLKRRAVFTAHSLSTSVDTFQSAHTDIFHIYIIIHAVFRTFTSETTLFDAAWKTVMSVIRYERETFLTERCFNGGDDSFVHANHACLKSFSNTPDLREILAVEIGCRKKRKTHTIDPLQDSESRLPANPTSTELAISTASSSVLNLSEITWRMPTCKGVEYLT
jgi:hypothetical protein